MTTPIAATDPTTIPAAKPGFKTSEFWLSIAALGIAVAGPQIDSAVSGAATSVNAHGWWGPIAAAAIAASYSAGRSIVKAKVAAPTA